MRIVQIEFIAQHVEQGRVCIINVNGAGRVSIRSFTVTGPFTSTGCSPDRYAGIRFENSSDGRVEYNHVTLIRDAGYTPAQRTTEYDIIKTY